MATYTGTTGSDSLAGGSGSDVFYGGDGTDPWFDGGDYIQADPDKFSTAAGTGGNDTITGGGGSDTIYAGYGNDVVYGENVNVYSGSDTIYGGNGDDHLAGGWGGDTIFGGQGNDTLFGEEGADYLYGGAGDIIYGGDDQDRIYLNWKMILAGLDGQMSDRDAVGMQDTSIYVYGGTGGVDNDTLYLHQGDALYDAYRNLSTTTDADGDSVSGSIEVRIQGTSIWQTVYFYEIENLSLNLPEISPDGTVEGTSGSDTINTAYPGDPDGDMIDGTDGINDIVYGYGGNDRIYSGSGHDRVYSGSGTNTVYGGSGNDSVYGGTGNETFYGGTGDDRLYGGSGNDRIQGDDGTDTLDGGSGSDQFFGGAGDLIYGGNDADQIFLYSGYASGTGSRTSTITVDGGTGGVDSDTLNLTNYTAYQNLTYSTDADGDSISGSVQVQSAYGWTTVNFTEIETLVLSDGSTVTAPTLDGTVHGTAGNDLIDASYTDADGDAVDGNDAILAGHSGNDDLIVAGAGNDYVNSGAGSDTIYAGDGNDRIEFSSDQADNDTVYGESGDDNVQVWSATGTLEAYGGETGETNGDNLNFVGDWPNTPTSSVTLTGDGTGTLTAGDQTINFYDFESFNLTGEEDGVFDASADTSGLTINTWGGNDTIIGGSGNDTLVGGEGSDTLTGGEGDDILDLSDFGDIYGGAADNTADLIVLTNGGGDDTVLHFDAPIDNGDGTFTGIDTFDPSGLQNAGGDPVSVNDVTVTDDGSGNAVLSFPNGESVTLIGVAPATADDVNWLRAVGFPSDGTISGTAGDDVINGAYPGDPDGDMVDGNDAVLAGHTGNDDLIDAGAGNDSIAAGGGSNTIYAGTGNDYISGGSGTGDVVYGGAGDDRFSDFYFTTQDSTFYGGDGYDQVYFHPLEGPTNTVLTGDGSGATSTGAAGSLTFESVERFIGTNSADTFDGTASNTALNVAGGAGDDSISGGSADDIIYGGTGADILDGNGGNDELNGAAGADTISGGDGNDTIYIANADDASGDAGDDLFILEDLGEGPVGPIVVTGGNDAETLGGGDTLQLGDLADLSTLNITSTTTNASGNTSYAGSVTLDDGTTLSFSEIENIVCFTRGTLIKTIDGERPIEDLQPGDRVLTYDRGFQPLRWIGSTRVAAIGKFAPIRFARGVLGNDRPLLVSPQHRMLLTGWQAELYTGETEVLVPATHLVNNSTITRLFGGEVEYFHMLFDQHELVFGNGCVSESFHPGEQGWSALCEETRQEILALFPDLVDTGFKSFGEAARYSVKRNEALCLAEDLRHWSADTEADARAFVA